MSVRILIIDDSATIRRQLKIALHETLEIVDFLEAPNGLRGLELLKKERPDLVLCDVVMPVMDGLKFLHLRAAEPSLLEIPVVMLTGEMDQAHKLAAFAKGAADHVVKPFDQRELAARIGVHLRLKILQDELREANRRLEQMARTDGLTGLMNRQYFTETLLAEFQRSLRYKTPFSVILLDIDHFKSVNDTHGHPMGDRVLRNVANILGALIRNTDHASRYGGEEFALLLPQTKAEGARRLGERLRLQLENSRHQSDEATLNVTASFGVAAFDLERPVEDPAALMKLADTALYQAKEQGRNRVCVAQSQG